MILPNICVCFCTGGPGSGKKEVAMKIAAQCQLVHLSAGELLRAFSELEAQESQDVAKLIQAGSLVPQEVILKVMQEEVKKNSEADGFVIDGFPRTVEQAESFVSEVGIKCSLEIYLQFSSNLIADKRQKLCSISQRKETEKALE